MELNIRPLDAAAVGLYLAAMLAIGFISARRSTRAEHYFVGHRNFPGWLIGLSMLGSIISSMTFLALPAAAYVLDWRQLTVNLMLPFVAIVAIVIFIPFFRRGGLTSAFEYLGDRFGQVARLYGTAGFIFLQLIRLAQVLFLMSLPMQFITGAPLEWVIVGAGIFVGLYTIAGGMETVVWADAVQAVIKILGGVLCLGCVLRELPGGFAQVIEVGSTHQKFNLGSFDWDLTQRTFWTVAILGLLNYLNIYSSEQTIVQRYVSARTTREARKATIIFSSIAVPVWTMFFFIGTSLFVFFRVFPDPAVAGLQPDQMLPYFVLTHVPAGLAGIVIAAVLAAAMSAIDSGVNSVATVTVVDVLRPFLPAGGARHDRRRNSACGGRRAFLLAAGEGEHERREPDRVQRARRRDHGHLHAGLFHAAGGWLRGERRAGLRHRAQHLPRPRRGRRLAGGLENSGAQLLGRRGGKPHFHGARLWH